MAGFSADAVVLLGYGGPNHPDDVVPFLRNATKGRGIPDERLKVVGQHYYLFGGVSPINRLTEALRAAIAAELEARGHAVPVVVGNRNWHPFVEDTFRQLSDDGARTVRALATSAYGSYSSCRQYSEDILRGLGALDEAARPSVTKVRPFFNTRGFIRANADALTRAWVPGAKLAFVTHSIPLSMVEASGAAAPADYVGQHMEVARLVVADLAARGIDVGDWELVYCSRSGAPHIPWLEPDVNDWLEEFAADDAAAPVASQPGSDLSDDETGAPPSSTNRHVVLAPIGFISDHMEVAYDLDTQAAETCERLGLGMTRVDTVGTDPNFVSTLVDLIEGRETERTEPAGELPRWTSTCSAACCVPGRPKEKS